MRTQQGLRVPNGEHRFEGEPKIWGTIPLQVKVSTDDTDGALFVFEHARMGKGGPPRHLHHEQEEWFYVIEAAKGLCVLVCQWMCARCQGMIRCCPETRWRTCRR
jgi:hypothetical protein